MAHNHKSRRNSHRIGSERDSTAMDNYSSVKSGSNYLRINNILNPSFTTIENLRDISSPSSSQTKIVQQVTSTVSTMPRIEPRVSLTRAKGGNGIPVMSDHHGAPPIRYFPHEYKDIKRQLSAQQQAKLDKAYKAFQVSPGLDVAAGLIADQPEWVPYVAKRDIQTTLKGFRTFTYSFQYPAETGKHWDILWDNAFGLVRMTNFFRALSFKKTGPAQAFKPSGLSDIAINNTGGKHTRQGYWLSYDCARALCMKFCFPIRYALVPIFGYDFIDQCIPPKEPGHRVYEIDNMIVAVAFQEARAYLVVGRNGMPKQKKIKHRTRKPSKLGRALCNLQDQGSDSEELSSMSEQQIDSEGLHSIVYSVYSQTTADSPEVSPRTRSANLAVVPSGFTSINQGRPRRQDIPELSGHPPRAGPLERAVPPSQSQRIRTVAFSPPSPRGQGVVRVTPYPQRERADDLVSKRHGRATPPLAPCTPLLVPDTDEYKEDDSASHSESDEEDIVVPIKSQRKDTKSAVTKSPTALSTSYTEEEIRAAEHLLMLIGSVVDDEE